MDWIYYLIGSNLATFILAWIIAQAVTRHQVVKEQAQQEERRRNTELWMEFIKAQGGEQ